MTRVIEWIVSLLIVIALFVVIGLFLPSTRTVSESAETNRPMSTVNDLVGSFTRFRDWNSLVNKDPRVQLTTSGPEQGVGAKLEFKSNDASIGNGSWTLIEDVPGEKIVYAVENEARGGNKLMTFRFERTGQRNQNVKITQRYTVDYGWDLLGRYAGLYVTRGIGDEIKAGLGKVSNLLATIPRFDYSQHEPGFSFVDLPATNALVVTTAAKRANDDIAMAMTNQLKWIEQVMEKSDLEPAGPMRIVTNEFSSDTYGFDIVMPIRRQGTGPAPVESDTPEAGEGDAAAEGEAVAEAEAEVAPVAPVDPNAPLELLDVTVEGPVVYAQLPAMRAATTTYTGPSPGLPRVRDLTKAWAMVRGAETWDRPYEEYLNPIKDMLMEEAEFRVYWPVRIAGVEMAEPVIIAPLPTEPEEEGAEAEEAPAEAPETPAAG
ncbi:MAG: SRPBCC family protein [Arenimonas sp.]|uniref:SRPBCC family protein n=1 Tax=Arenimonas sp. TaxID=1872635 RepID=UPI0025BDE40A|nr:SRPBCC family protein [Arenimonas sp.]MBW8366382.1 SRPBCC family protein [Arenimonas sp.]